MALRSHFRSLILLTYFFRFIHFAYLPKMTPFHGLRLEIGFYRLKSVGGSQGIAFGD